MEQSFDSAINLSSYFDDDEEVPVAWKPLFDGLFQTKAFDERTMSTFKKSFRKQAPWKTY